MTIENIMLGIELSNGASMTTVIEGEVIDPQIGRQKVILNGMNIKGSFLTLGYSSHSPCGKFRKFHNLEPGEYIIGENEIVRVIKEDGIYKIEQNENRIFESMP